MRLLNDRQARTVTLKISGGSGGARALWRRLISYTPIKLSYTDSQGRSSGSPLRSDYPWWTWRAETIAPRRIGRSSKNCGIALPIWPQSLPSKIVFYEERPVSARLSWLLWFPGHQRGGNERRQSNRRQISTSVRMAGERGAGWKEKCTDYDENRRKGPRVKRGGMYWTWFTLNQGWTLITRGKIAEYIQCGELHWEYTGIETFAEMLIRSV